MSIVEFFLGNRQDRKVLEERDQLRSRSNLRPKAAQRLEDLEKQATGINRRLFLRRIGAGGLVTATAASPFVWSLIERQPRSFKDRVLSFSWDRANGTELEAFVDDLAEEYLKVTQTNRVNKSDLAGKGKINYFPNREKMVEAIRTINPSFPVGSNLYGYTDYYLRKIFISLPTLKEQASATAKENNEDPNKNAGLALLDGFWHEFGHLETQSRVQGELLNNPDYFFFSPRSNKNEVFRRYQGMQVFTDTYFGFLWFDEVVNETITVRRMFEQVGLREIITVRDYYPNGVDFFPNFTSAVGIDLNTLYQLHATSDFEGLIKLIGSKLPGSRFPAEKGMDLARAIHQSNSQLIEQTGVYSLLPKK